MKTVTLSDRVAVLATIDPDVTVASTVTSGWVSMVRFTNILAIILFGTAGSSATLDAKLEQATSSGGAGAKDITGKLITQMLVSDKQSQINCNAEELDVEGDFTHVRLSVTIAVATSDLCALILGGDPRHDLASDNDVASVVEIVR